VYVPFPFPSGEQLLYAGEPVHRTAHLSKIFFAPRYPAVVLSVVLCYQLLARIQLKFLEPIHYPLFFKLVLVSWLAIIHLRYQPNNEKYY
jgi:hypothetical protein